MRNHPAVSEPGQCSMFLDELGGSSSNGRNQEDSLIKHGEYWAQHDELHGACFNASKVTTGKTNDNTNDGMVEISDDERLDKKLKFSSKNIWEYVEFDEFMEHVRQGLDSQPSSPGGNQAMLIQLPSHILPLNHDLLISPTGRVDDHVDNDHHGVLPLNHDPLISSTMRVGDHVDSDYHGLCVPENMGDSQKVSCFHQLIIPYEQIADRKIQMFETVTSHARQNISLEYYVTWTWFKHIPKIAGIYCKDCCACDNCLNKPDYEDIVLYIRHQFELHNPLAFAPPIVYPPNDSLDVTVIITSIILHHFSL
ncbi:hypothetical protein J1N35_012823 [Gossypium stocksii]|uniref:Uncharacterized protein n=2 Tax=Gossypium TaxID=3633 RepID=A0A9D3W6S6_9ROSI|nr:hypothetical protein J1N35_012823 [Gossypium stocksii]